MACLTDVGAHARVCFFEDITKIGLLTLSARMLRGLLCQTPCENGTELAPDNEHEQVFAQHCNLLGQWWWCPREPEPQVSSVFPLQ